MTLDVYRGRKTTMQQQQQLTDRYSFLVDFIYRDVNREDPSKNVQTCRLKYESSLRICTRYMYFSSWYTYTNLHEPLIF